MMFFLKLNIILKAFIVLSFYSFYYCIKWLKFTFRALLRISFLVKIFILHKRYVDNVRPLSYSFFPDTLRNACALQVPVFPWGVLNSLLNNL